MITSFWFSSFLIFFEFLIDCTFFFLKTVSFFQNSHESQEQKSTDNRMYENRKKLKKPIQQDMEEENAKRNVNEQKQSK